MLFFCYLFFFIHKDFELTLTSSNVNFDVGHLEECILDLLQRSKFMQKSLVYCVCMYVLHTVLKLLPLIQILASRAYLNFMSDILYSVTTDDDY